jgi:predicted site-specific integrase-resolvase
MKLSQWAKKQGISYITAFRWFKAKSIPNARQTPSGTILVDDEIINPISSSNTKNVIYARVSNQSRKKELDYQVKRCEDFCAAKGIIVHKVFKEVASGMNDKRQQLWKMLDLSPTMLIIENKDRLTRFGFTYLQNLLAKLNCQVLVMNEVKEDKEDLMKDLVSVITSFCCRIYGLRRAKNKADKIKKILLLHEK